MGLLCKYVGVNMKADYFEKCLEGVPLSLFGSRFLDLRFLSVFVVWREFCEVLKEGHLSYGNNIFLPSLEASGNV